MLYFIGVLISLFLYSIYVDLQNKEVGIANSIIMGLLSWVSVSLLLADFMINKIQRGSFFKYKET
jgi:hypothetical protein